MGVAKSLFDETTGKEKQERTIAMHSAGHLAFFLFIFYVYFTYTRYLKIY